MATALFTPRLPLLAAVLAALAARPAAGYSSSSLLLLRAAGAAGPPNCPSADAACSRAAQVFLDEYAKDGSGAYQLAASTAVPGVTLSSTDFFLGALSPCADGSCVAFAANTDAPGTAPGATAPFFPAPRVIVRVNMDGSVDTSTRLAASDYDGIIKGVCSFDGSGYWVVGNASNGGCVGYVKHGATAGSAGAFTVVSSCASGDGPMAGHYTSCVASINGNISPSSAASSRTLLFARTFNGYGLVDVAQSAPSTWTVAGGMTLQTTTTAALDSAFSDIGYVSQIVASRAQNLWWTLDPAGGTCGVQQCLGAASVYPAMQPYLVDTRFDPQPPSCGWPANLSNVQCFGLTNKAASSAAECAAAACALKVPGWQWLAGPGCWVGPTGGPNVCRPSPDAWVGGGLTWTSSTGGCRTLFTFSDVCAFGGLALSRDEGTLFYTAQGRLYSHGSNSGGNGAVLATLPPFQEWRGVARAPARCSATGGSPFAGFYCPFGANSSLVPCPSGNWSAVGDSTSCALPLPTPSSTPAPSTTPSNSPTSSVVYAEKPCWATSTLAGPDWVTPNNPKGLTWDAKTSALYICDTGLNEVTKISGTGASGVGVTSTPWVGWSGVRGDSDGAGTNALFYWPNFIAADDTTGTFYITDGC
jgi:hypothetical protein